MLSYDSFNNEHISYLRLMLLLDRTNLVVLFNLFPIFLRTGEAAYDLYSFLLFFDAFLIWEVSTEGCADLANAFFPVMRCDIVFNVSPK
jgi:hypothetical protein